jgi:hypothetical protein
MSTHRLTIDLVTERASDGAFILVLVEEGPWDVCELDARLRQVQERLYDCVDAAIDGHLVARYPDSRGKPVVIRLDCYDAPDEPLNGFLKRFADHIARSPELQRDFVAQGFVQSLSFEYHHRTLERRD